MAKKQAENAKKKGGPVKGMAKPQPNEEQKKEIVTSVCAMYESQYCTIESCCEACGISIRGFRLWLAQNAEYAEIYNKSKERSTSLFWEELVKPKSETAFIRHLDNYAQVSVKEEKGESDGKRRDIKTTLTKEVMPSPVIVLAGMKASHPDKFKDDDGDKSIIITFTDDAQNDFMPDAGEPDSE